MDQQIGGEMMLLDILFISSVAVVAIATLGDMFLTAKASARIANTQTRLDAVLAETKKILEEHAASAGRIMTEVGNVKQGVTAISDAVYVKPERKPWTDEEVAAGLEKMAGNFPTTNRVDVLRHLFDEVALTTERFDGRGDFTERTKELSDEVLKWAGTLDDQALFISLTDSETLVELFGAYSGHIMWWITTDGGTIAPDSDSSDDE